MTAPAIVVLGRSAQTTARRIQALYPGATVHGLAARVEADVAYDELGAHLRELYALGTPIVALCAAGIVIRCIAPMLAEKRSEPPVLAVAEDGSTVVPLLGGLSGVNAMARAIAQALEVSPAITTSGELRFGTCLLNPPDGYTLASLEQGKRFVSDLLAGEEARIDGDAPWLDDAKLPCAASARLTIRVTPNESEDSRDELVIHPRSVVAAIGDGAAPAADRVLEALREHRLAPLSLAALLAPSHRIGERQLEDAARLLGVPLRFAPTGTGAALAFAAEDSSRNREPEPVANCQSTDPSPARTTAQLLGAAMPVPHDVLAHSNGVVLGVAAKPVSADVVGRARGCLTVVGLGPGCAELMVPAARTALNEATDILGYETYVKMAGPFRIEQRVHGSDNREELQRARHAFDLASEGNKVAMVSSGDPGVFAMAAAVLEALDSADDPRWRTVELRIVPGVSAAMATAAVAGAPLGHDFCMLSLSDNLKPWTIIEKRLRHAAEADLVMAFYNPISRARPWQLDRALDIVRTYRRADTRVVLGRDIGRPGATLVTTTLGELRSEQVDMRTMVIVGSSTTRGVAGAPHGEWIFTPRWYPADDERGPDV
ncbi:MAG TPA: precorrin-3B C(17)-methyltransferase [Trinickia sp.]|uniref:precorrin-3B C(17)-methyltransferase n=1 Tax=Trinickia sp. TaxID=2571163 RepID=UPI002C96EB62|nr:precorrin-3B C(17)-methyltransferase [Trinickia sp.]HTI17168.1 precorrin-3B C(17)-methyltransferase [Trinickia sp.]